MSKKRWKTALIGFGRIAQGNASNRAMSSKMKYATHAQVLREHSDFEWVAVVDKSSDLLAKAQTDWQITSTAVSASELECREEIEVAVLAVAPDSRGGLLQAFPNLKAVLVEKPLGVDLQSAASFVAQCRRQNILLQTNLLRRADRFTRTLASGLLAELIGKPQLASGIYGNGLLNNGTHIIDLVRLLLGEITSVQALTGRSTFQEGPIAGDTNCTFALNLSSAKVVCVQPVQFANYRENGLDIWGEGGRFQYLNGGFTLLHSALAPNRVTDEQMEVQSDSLRAIPSTLGDAFYEMYTNLSDTLAGEASLLSSGESALVTAGVVEAIFRSLSESGRVVPLDEITASIKSELTHAL